jgi:hypothetical protein
MNRKQSGTAQQVRHTSANGDGPSDGVASRSRQNVSSAMNSLLNGYREEASLYLRVRRLAWRQRDILRGKLDLNLFRDLFEEKEDLLRMISRIESEMKSAKSCSPTRLRNVQTGGNWKCCSTS